MTRAELHLVATRPLVARSGPVLAPLACERLPRPTYSHASSKTSSAAAVEGRRGIDFRMTRLMKLQVQRLRKLSRSMPGVGNPSKVARCGDAIFEHLLRRKHTRREHNPSSIIEQVTMPHLQSNNPYRTASADAQEKDDDLPPPTYEEATAATTIPRAQPQPKPNGIAQVPSLPPPVPLARQLSPPQGRNPFAPSFNVYRLSWNTMTLGEQKMRPTHYVRRHTGLSGSPNVVLHAGPAEDHPQLATLRTSLFQDKMTIAVPPVQDVTEMTNSTWVYRFRFGNDTFEWRESQSAAVRALGASSQGWKLVRIGARARPGHAVSSDGFEIVAVWAPTSWKGSKLASFSFLGSGAEGVLGPRWAVTVVVSALGLLEEEE